MWHALDRTMRTPSSSTPWLYSGMLPLYLHERGICSGALCRGFFHLISLVNVVCEYYNCKMLEHGPTGCTTALSNCSQLNLTFRVIGESTVVVVLCLDSNCRWLLLFSLDLWTIHSGASRARGSVPGLRGDRFIESWIMMETFYYTN